MNIGKSPHKQNSNQATSTAQQSAAGVESNHTGTGTYSYISKRISSQSGSRKRQEGPQQGRNNTLSIERECIVNKPANQCSSVALSQNGAVFRVGSCQVTWALLLIVTELCFVRLPRFVAKRLTASMFATRFFA